MNRRTRKLRKLTNDSLDAIYNASVKSARGWEKRATSIPVDLFCRVADKGRWDTKGGSKTDIDYIKKYNAMLTLLKSAVRKNAKSFGSESVGLNALKEMFEIIKTNIDKGIHEKAA